MLLLRGSAEHDERPDDDPELFDIHRRIDRPMSSGSGVHRCLGAAPARLETRAALSVR